MLQRLSTPSLRAIDPATLTPQAIAEYEIFDISLLAITSGTTAS